jgi:hypothetical protein
MSRIFRACFYLLSLIALVAFASPSLARGHSSSGSRPYYGGGHHSTSHGGHYQGGSGSSHKHGHYKNPKTQDQYGKHKP